MLTKLKVWVYIFILKYWYGYGDISTSLIYAQAVHETGKFKSDVFRENNNLFGMRQAQQRKNTATGTNRGHATYKNIFSSVNDYFKRQKYFSISSRTDAQFVDDTINSNYATDVAYKAKWLNIANSTKKPVSNVLIFGLFFLLIIPVLRIAFKTDKPIFKK